MSGRPDPADILVLVIDNATFGAIRMHQERISRAPRGHVLRNLDFAAMG